MALQVYMEPNDASVNVQPGFYATQKSLTYNT